MSQRILYVDNAEYFRKRIHETYNEKFVLAETFKEALTAIDTNKDIALMVTELIDVQQYNISIVQLVNHAREFHAPSYFPVVAFTNLEPKSFEEQAKHLGLDAVIIKHIRYLDSLFKCIDTLLQNPDIYKGNPRFLRYSSPKNKNLIPSQQQIVPNTKRKKEPERVRNFPRNF